MCVYIYIYIYICDQCISLNIYIYLCKQEKQDLGQCNGWQRSTEVIVSQCLLSCLSCVRLFATLCTVAYQPPLSIGLSRQEYWSGLPCLPPGIKPSSPLTSALAGGFFTWEALLKVTAMHQFKLSGEFKCTAAVSYY